MNLFSIFVVAMLIFSIGLFGALSRKSLITILMSIELMFNSIVLLAVGFSRLGFSSILYLGRNTINEEVLIPLLSGHVFGIFIITVSAAEVALGLALVLTLYRSRNTANVDEINELRN